MNRGNIKTPEDVVFDLDLVREESSDEFPKPRERIDLIVNSIVSGAVRLLQRTRPDIAEELELILSDPETKVKAIEIIKSEGENSVEATAALVAVALDGIDQHVVEAISEQLGTVLAHHLYEVGFDSGDKGVENTAREIGFLQTVTSIARCVAQLQISADNFPAGQLAPAFASIDEKLQKAIRRKIVSYGLPEDMRLGTLTYADILQANINGVEEIANLLSDSDSISEGRKRFRQFGRNALDGRYEAVYEIGDIKDRGYRNMTIENSETVKPDMDRAIEMREKAILIEVTMSTIMDALYDHIPEFAHAIDYQEEEVEEAQRTAAQIIGIWNDLGSKVSRMKPYDLIMAMDYIKAGNNSNGDMRSLFAPDQYRREIEAQSAKTSDLAYIRGEGIPDEITFWRMFNQLLKDAPKEHNLFFDLDYAGDEFIAKLELLILLTQRAQTLETLLARQLSNLPEPVADFIRNIVVFHGEMYTGGDYYGLDSFVLKMPSVNGNSSLDNYRLFTLEEEAES